MEGLILLAKILIDYSLKNKENIYKKIKGIKRDNSIIFNDDDSIMNIEILGQEVIVRREDKDSINEIHFGNKSYSKYYLKEYQKSINIDITLIELEIEENNLKITYSIENDIKEFSIHYEVI